MKKLGFVVIPLMTISLLASCGGDIPTPPKPTECTLTLTLDNCNVGGQPTYSKTYNEGATIEPITVSPNNGFVLNENSVEASYKQYWSKATGENYTFSNLKMNSDYTIVITATEPTPAKYTLVVICKNGKVTGNQGEYEANEDVALTFAADPDYVLPTSKDVIEITGIDKSAVTYDSSTGSLSFKMPANKVMVTVIATPKSTRHTLIATCIDGYVSGAGPGYYKDEIVSFHIGTEGHVLPPSVEYFTKIKGIDPSAITYTVSSVLSADVTFKMPANEVTIIITAYSPLLAFTLSTTCNNGTVTGNQGVYLLGQDVSLTFKANDGYVLPPSKDNIKFAGIIDTSMINYNSETGSITFKMPPHNVSITVTAVDPSSIHTLTVTCNNVEVTGNQEKYLKDTNVALTFTADAGYVLPKSLDAITITGIDKSKVIYDGGSGSMTFAMPDEDVTIAVTATKIWYLDEDYINGLDENDIGTKQTIKVNGINQEVRLIDINHDNLTNGQGKAHTTWEFVNLLSDSDGYSLATVWDWEDAGESTNCDFPNSNLRKALDGGGNAELSWYQKGSTTKSTTYIGSALSMLPADLQGVLKEVNKPIATTSSYEVTSYDTKLFTLSYREITAEENPYVKEEGTTYQYYKNHDDDLSRVHKQVNGGEVYVETPKITDGKYGSAHNYAGYNSRADNTEGGRSWLRSPATSYSYLAWHCDSDGNAVVDFISYHTLAVAPAFCI